MTAISTHLLFQRSLILILSLSSRWKRSGPSSKNTHESIFLSLLLPILFDLPMSVLQSAYKPTPIFQCRDCNICVQANTEAVYHPFRCIWLAAPSRKLSLHNPSYSSMVMVDPPCLLPCRLLLLIRPQLPKSTSASDLNQANYQIRHLSNLFEFHVLTWLQSNDGDGSCKVG